MATELKFKQDEEDQQQTALTGPSSPSEASSGQEGSTPSPQAPSRGAMPAKRPNVQQYLQANQGAGQRLAGGIEQKTQKQAQEVGRGISQAGEQLQASSRPLEQDLGEQGSQKIQTAFRDPANILKQQEQLDQFRRLSGRGYEQDIGKVGEVASQQKQALGAQVNQLGQTADLSGTEGGRFELLRQTYGQPNYTRGQQRLDQLFLQAQPGAARELRQNLQNIQQQQGQQLNAFDTAAQAKLAALNQLSGARADEWQRLLSGGTSADLESDITQRGLGDIASSSQARLAEAQERAKTAQGIQDRLASRQLSPEEIINLGLQSGQSVYDVNMNEYLRGTDFNPTLAGAASPEEFARYRALRQLAGDTSNDIFGGAEAGGTWNPYQVDLEGLKSQLDARKQYYEQDLLNQTRDAYLASTQGASGGYFGASPELRAMQQQYQEGIKTAKSAEDIERAMQNYARNYLTRYGGGQGVNPDGTVVQSEFDYMFGQNDPLRKYIDTVKKQRQNVVGAPAKSGPKFK